MGGDKELCPWSCGCDPADFDVLVNSFLNFFKEVDLYPADKHKKVKPTPPQTRQTDHGMVDRAALRHGPKKPIKKTPMKSPRFRAQTQRNFFGFVLPNAPGNGE